MSTIRKIATAIAFLALMCGFATITAAPATAALSASAAASETEEPPSCDDVNTDKGTGDCADVVEAESHSSSSSSSKVVAVNGVKLTSKVTVLANIKANGTPKSQQTNCFRIKKAMSLWTSYNAEGTTGWHWKTYPKGYRFCKINGKVRDPKCHNQVKIGVPKSHPPKNAIKGKVKFVKVLKWEAKAVATADEKVTSAAKAWCNTSSAHADAAAKASATALAVGRASLKGRVVVKLLARVRAAAAGDLSAQLGGRSVVQVRADVRASAFAKATTDAWAKVSCSDTPPPTDACPNIPGPQEPGYHCYPPEGEIVQWPEHLFPGGTYRAKVVGSDVEDKGNVTLSYTVTGGASIVNNADYPTICDVEGGQRVCTFWIKAGQTAGTNATLTLVVEDTDGRKSPTYSKTWPIVADEF